MRFKTVLFVGRAITYMGPRQNEGWTLRLRASRAQRPVDSLKIVAICDRLDVPAISLEAARAILGEGDVGPSRQRHTVIVIEVDQLAEFQMTGKGRGLRGYALHQIAVTDDPVGEMIDDLRAGPVVTRRQVGFGHREADAVTKALTERSGCRLDARRNATLGMPRRHAAPLAKMLDLFKGKIVAGEVKQAVQQHRAMPRRQHETVAIKPSGIGWIIFEEPGPQH